MDPVTGGVNRNLQKALSGVIAGISQAHAKLVKSGGGIEIRELGPARETVGRSASATFYFGCINPIAERA